MDARSEALEIKYAAATRTIEALKTAIHTVFQDTGCNTPATLELLGGAGVTESNVLQFLALIEQRAHEIVQLYLQRHGRNATPAVQVRSRSVACMRGVVASEIGAAADVRRACAPQAEPSESRATSAAMVRRCARVLILLSSSHACRVLTCVRALYPAAATRASRPRPRRLRWSWSCPPPRRSTTCPTTTRRRRMTSGR